MAGIKTYFFVGAFFLAVLSQGRAYADFRFPWRSFYSSNAVRFLPPARPPAENAPSLSPRDCLTVLTYNGFGATTVRPALKAALRKSPSLPDSAAWLEYALRKRYMRPLPVVGATARVSGALALEMAVLLSGEGGPALSDDDYDRLGELGLIPAWLCLRFAGPAAVERPSAEMLAVMTAAAPASERVFFYTLAASRPADYASFALARLSASGDDFERACALMVPASLPADKRPPSFSAFLQKLLRSPDERASVLAALAAWRARSHEAVPLLLPRASSSPACAVALGGCLPAPEAMTLLGKEVLPPLAEGYLLLGAAAADRDVFPAVKRAITSDSAELRALAAIAAGMSGGPRAVLLLRSLFQDAAYEVRACSVLAAGFLDRRHAFSVLRPFVQDKHHQELSAMASVLLAANGNPAVPRMLDGADEYTFDRERGFALFALGCSSPSLFALRAPEWSDARSPFLKRMLSLGGIMSGNPSWLETFERSIVEFQDYVPWGAPDALRTRALELLVPDPFDFLVSPFRTVTEGVGQ